jgi:hypothetical protein
MMDLVVGRDRRRSTPKLDNRDGRGHYLTNYSNGSLLIRAGGRGGAAVPP